MRQFLIITLLIPGLALADPPIGPPTNPESCSTLFQGLMDKVSVRTGRAAYRAELEQIEQIPVKDIFPDSVVRRGKTLVKVTEKNKADYQSTFDRLWENRYMSGQVPYSEVSAYRAWLKAKYGKPYPPLEAEVLYKDFVTADPTGSIAGYFDDAFLDYLYESKKLTVENFDDYVKQIDPSMVRRFGKRALKAMGKTKDYVITAAITASLMQFSTIPGDLVSNAINGLSQAFFGSTLKDWINGKTKEVTETVGEKVRDWNLFAGGEEKYISTLLALKMASTDLEARDFDKLNRAEAMRVLESFKNSTSDKLPLFRDLLLSEQKDFEKLWDNRLQELKQSTVAVSSVYQQYKIALDRIQADIAGRETPGVATPEELALLADYSQEMAGAETFLANSLADWMFYKQARGAKNPIDPALDLNFSMVYNSYMRMMSPGKLADALNARVVNHVAQLEKYSKKAAGKEAEIPAGPEKKPEDQIKEGTEKIINPTPFPPFGGPR